MAEALRVQVTVTSPRGNGATTTAVRLARFLRSEGASIEIVGQSAAHERLLRKMVNEIKPINALRPLVVTVCDPGDLHTPPSWLTDEQLLAELHRRVGDR